MEHVIGQHSTVADHPDLTSAELAVGLLRFDDPAASAQETAAGYGYRIYTQVVKGMTPATAKQPDANTKTALQEAIDALMSKNVVGICGESALMLPLQSLARTMARVPVFLSSMMQAAMLLPAHDKGQVFALFTKYAKGVAEDKSRIAQECGLTDLNRFIIVALPDKPDVTQVSKMYLDMKKETPALAGAIFDCEELIAHADQVRAVTSAPIFDQVTLVDFFCSAQADNPYFGTSYEKHLENPQALLLKAQRKLVSPYAKYVNSIASNVDKDTAIGVLRIDYSYPPIPGDIDHPASYGYKVKFKTVTGLTFERAQAAEMTSEIQESFKTAIAELEKEGVVAITGDCGFMMAYQPYVRAITDLPVVLSSILQAPMLVASYEPEAKFAIFTANSSTFDKELLLAQSGMKVDPNQWIVVGLQDLPGFEAVALGQQVPAEKVQPGIEKCVKQLQEKEPALKAILLECTELPHYADAIRATTKLPVVDAITVVDYFQSACSREPSFAKKSLEAFVGALNPVTIASAVVAIPVGILGSVVAFGGHATAATGKKTKKCGCVIS